MSAIVAAGSLAVVIFDAVGAYASNRFGFRYTNLALGSFCIYGAVGAVVARANSVEAAALAAGLVAAVDATLGWTISWRIGPGRLPNADEAKIVSTAVFVTALGFLCGAIGASVSLVLR